MDNLKNLQNNEELKSFLTASEEKSNFEEAFWMGQDSREIASESITAASGCFPIYSPGSACTWVGVR
jgi:hypothetical protein